MSADTPPPLPSIVDLVARLTANLTTRFKPGDPVDEDAFDEMVGHLRDFQQLAEAVDAELGIYRELLRMAERDRNAAFHQQPETMQ